MSSSASPGSSSARPWRSRAAVTSRMPPRMTFTVRSIVGALSGGEAPDPFFRDACARFVRAPLSRLKRMPCSSASSVWLLRSIAFGPAPKAPSTTSEIASGVAAASSAKALIAACRRAPRVRSPW